MWLVTDSKLNWVNNNKYEWTDTKMVFEIIPIGNETTVQFTHEDLLPPVKNVMRVASKVGFHHQAKPV